MNNRKNFPAALAVCACLVVLIIVLFSVFGMKSNRIEVHFPTSDDVTAPDNSMNRTDGGEDAAQVIVIDAGSVGYALNTLEKPKSYSCAYTIENYWETGSTQHNVNVYARNDVIRISVNTGSFVKETILTDDNYFMWYSDGGSLISGSRSDVLNRPLIENAVQMSGSFQNVLDISPENVLSAEYVEYESSYCVHISANEGDFGYRSEYYISLDTGLLFENSVFDGDRLIYRMKLINAQLSAPEDSYFTLPDGTVIE